MVDDTSQPAPRPAAPPEGRTPGEAFEALVELMRTLRSPEGCPWDRAQTLESLLPFVIEEAHEVVDAVERGALDDLRGEIGDLVFEGVFLAQLTAESGTFTITDALNEVRAKLVRRHPHVFAPDAETAHITTPEAVKDTWEAIKSRERAGKGAAPKGRLEGLPAGLPALLYASRVSGKAAATGFDWQDARQVLDKVDEEVAELRAALDAGNREQLAEELGDVLFAAANLARKLDLDPEAVLRAANRKFVARFTAMEKRLAEAGTPIESATLDQMEAAWQEVKRP